MTQSLQFKTIEDIKQYSVKLQTIKMQLPAFAMITVKQLGMEIILNAIHKRMKSAGFSQKIINGTKLDRIEIISNSIARLFFVSEYFSETGYDVALGREKGSDTHKVTAGEGKTIPIPTSSGIIFRKSANPSGVEALHIVGKTVKEFSSTLQKEYDITRTEWQSQNLGGLAIAS